MANVKLYKTGKEYQMVSRSYGYTEFVKPETEDEKIKERLRISFSRTRSRIRELIVCNHFEHFVTVTFKDDNGQPPQRKPSLKKVANALRAIKRIAPDLKYMIVPEISDSGRFHVHILTSLPPEILTPFTTMDDFLPEEILKKIEYGVQCYDAPVFSKRCGFTLVEKINYLDETTDRISTYLCKTMYFDRMRGYEKGTRRVITSRNLERKQLLFAGEISDEDYEMFELAAIKVKENMSGKTLVFDGQSVLFGENDYQ